MKKIFTILLAFICMIPLAGCQPSNQESDVATNPKLKKETEIPDDQLSGVDTEANDNEALDEDTESRDDGVLDEDTEPNDDEALDVDTLVAKVLLAETSRMYTQDECQTEAHIVLGQETKGNNTVIYALSMVGNYGFENGIFTKVSGSGVIPVVITLDENNVGSIEYPMDGSEYAKSIKKMFPEKYQQIIWDSFDNDSDAHNELKAQEVAYAMAHLKKIGREAQIKEHVDKILLTDRGISVEVSNGLETFFKGYNNYPYFIGNQEKLEDGIRVVYEMKYHEEASEIEFVKYNYDTKEVIEQFFFDAKTGEPFEK